MHTNMQTTHAYMHTSIQAHMYTYISSYQSWQIAEKWTTTNMRAHACMLGLLRVFAYLHEKWNSQNHMSIDMTKEIDEQPFDALRPLLLYVLFKIDGYI